MIYYEKLVNNQVVARKEVLSISGITLELMSVPILTIDLDIGDKISLSDELVIYIGEYVFHGIVITESVDYRAKTKQLQMNHIMHEWTFEVVGTNTSVYKVPVSAHLQNPNFVINGWNIHISNINSHEVYHVFSRDSKLQALKQMIELTPYAYWRISLQKDRHLEVGHFGQGQSYILTTVDNINAKLINILSLKKTTKGLKNVQNLSVVYADKSDTGFTNLNLRDAFARGNLEAGFPIVVVRNNVNNERRYDYIQHPRIAPNGNLEFGILDQVGVQLTKGIVIEGSMTFNNIGATNNDDNEVTDQDRIDASLNLYRRAVREMIASRSYDEYTVEVTNMPIDLKVGDKVRLLIDEDVQMQGVCHVNASRLVNIDKEMYVTRIVYELVNFQMLATLTLREFLTLGRDV